MYCATNPGRDGPGFQLGGCVGELPTARPKGANGDAIINGINPPDLSPAHILWQYVHEVRMFWIIFGSYSSKFNVLWYKDDTAFYEQPFEFDEDVLLLGPYILRLDYPRPIFQIMTS